MGKEEDGAEAGEKKKKGAGKDKLAFAVWTTKEF